MLNGAFSGAYFLLHIFIHTILNSENSSDLGHFILTPRDKNDQITRQPEAPDLD